MRDLRGASTRVECLSQTWRHPILLAPVAYQQLAHPDGELATALAASAQEAGFVLSQQSSTPLEQVARAHGRGTGALWLQLTLLGDPGLTNELVARARQAGYQALVVTVDAPTSGARDRERAAGFRLPAGVEAVHLTGRSSASRRGDPPGDLFQHLHSQAPTWADIDRLVSSAGLPVLLKGVLHEDDARTAVAAGVAGLIVSNHGGRTLDTALASALALSGIAEAVQNRVPVLVDGGIRRGTDVLKALALGARGVMIGRPLVHGLAVAGAAGVAHVLRLLRDELEIAMALCGCADLARADRSLLRGAEPRVV
jgi:4-hydroxymandelate oxidase